MNRSSLETNIQNEFDQLKAAEAADLVLSPFVSPRLLLTICHEAGPTNWVVNRSDVYDATLEALLKHPMEAISSRAAEKLKLRRSTLTHLTPPELPRSFEDISDHEVEDFLGHPLCPFEAMVFFSESLKEDHRASSALSLTRRVLEHPPDWSINPFAKQQLGGLFGRMLLSDPSPMARSYAARVPLIQESVLHSAAENETHFFVLGRILQNPARTIIDLENVASDEICSNSFVGTTLALDSQLPQSVRKKLIEQPPTKLCSLIHEWYLKNQ